ncbi:MAG: metal-dependent hydrolase, partial [Lysobacterales bacterium]
MWLTSAVLFGVSLQSPTLFFVVLGSLLPDIDTSSSWIGRLGGPLTQAIERHFGHRTLTHSIIGVICFSGLVLPLYFFRPGWYFSLILGYVSHLTADLFTKAGICL